MPFIDDELLWCPDNDGKMVDLTQCLQVIKLYPIQISFFIQIFLLFIDHWKKKTKIAK